jgi:putative transposase
LGRANRIALRLWRPASRTRAVKQVEIWFNTITQKAIRRGTFGSVKELVAKIEYFVHRYNAEARPFSWTATPDSILEKIQRLYERISGTQH